MTRSDFMLQLVHLHFDMPQHVMLHIMVDNLPGVCLLCCTCSVYAYANGLGANY